jgi:hypothetical protein
MRLRAGGSLITVWLEVRVLPGPPLEFVAIVFISVFVLAPAPDDEVRE